MGIFITTTATFHNSLSIAMATTLTWTKIFPDSAKDSPRSMTRSWASTILSTFLSSRKKTVERKAISPDPHLPLCFLTSRPPSKHAHTHYTHVLLHEGKNNERQLSPFMYSWFKKMDFATIQS